MSHALPFMGHTGNRLLPPLSQSSFPISHIVSSWNSTLAATKLNTTST